MFLEQLRVYYAGLRGASAGQPVVQYRSLTLYDQDFGTVTLQAATLVGVSSTRRSDHPAAVSLVVTQGTLPLSA